MRETLEPTPLRATPPAESPELGAVVWTTVVDALTGEPLDEVVEYSADARQLIAAVPATALPAGATLEAAWTYNNTSLDALTTTLSTNEMASRRWIDFKLERAADSQWPAGTYEVVISLEGVQLQHASIMVTDED
jgi:hypothetical protein